MNPLDQEREIPRPQRRPGHDRDDSRQERERDYVKEVRPPARDGQHGHRGGRPLH